MSGCESFKTLERDKLRGAKLDLASGVGRRMIASRPRQDGPCST
jgi:hypothetical protein